MSGGGFPVQRDPRCHIRCSLYYMPCSATLRPLHKNLVPMSVGLPPNQGKKLIKRCSDSIRSSKRRLRPYLDIINVNSLLSDKGCEAGII